MATTETLEIKNYIGLTGDKPIRFIASDVDGTLVTDAKAIPEDAIEAIRAARESRRWWIRQLNKRNISHEDAMRYACLIAAADDLLFLRTPPKVKKLIEQHDVA